MAGRIEDWYEIERLVSGLCRAIDSRDWVRFEGMFTAEAQIETMPGHGGSTVSVPDFVVTLTGLFEALGVRATQHFAPNPNGVISGDVAAATCNLVGIGVLGESGETIVSTGALWDFRFVRGAQGWRIGALREQELWTSVTNNISVVEHVLAPGERR